MITNEDVLKTLGFVIDPDTKKDIVSQGSVSNIEIDGTAITFQLAVSNPTMHHKKRMEEACEHQLKSRLGDEVKVTINVATTERPTQPKEHPLKNVKNIIAVASGKGGVGKSTVTANLAAGLVANGYRVGIVDADIYGPSIPLMFDVTTEKPAVKKVDGKSVMIPVESYGVKILSIGFFAESDKAVAWRGPMASKALSQLFLDADWGTLDYLLVDLPPGTGDIHLTLVQSVNLHGAIVVTTPQPIALADAKKGIAMFQMSSINVPVLGLVENMSYFTPEELPDKKYYLFGRDGAKDLSITTGIPLLGQLPLVQSVREAGDAGRPAVLQQGTSQSEAFSHLAKAVDEAVNQTHKVV